jgi:hypothetical protein
MIKRKRRHLGSIASDELELFIDNNEPVYRRKQAAFVNLTKHVCRGSFNKVRGAKLMRYVTDEASRQYMKEFNPGEKNSFLTSDRQEAAESLVKEYLGKLKDCIKRGMCNDLPSGAVTLLKAQRCKVGGELDGAKKTKKRR